MCANRSSAIDRPGATNSPHQPSIEPVEELSDVSPLVVVAPASHDGVDLLYQLLSVHGSPALRELANLVFEVADGRNDSFHRHSKENVFVKAGCGKTARPV